MTVSRVSFDPTKNYVEVQFNEDVPLLDSELNEQQKIKRFFAMDANQKLFGASVQGDDWLIYPSASANTFVVKAGTFFFGGYQFILFQDQEIGGLTTPGINRQDTVYVIYQEVIVNSLQDPDILDPAVGFETTQRIQLSFQIMVSEGSEFPATVPPGFSYFQIGTLNRLGGNSNITAAMIQDDRAAQVHTYVLAGLSVVAGTGGPFNVLANPGVARIGDQDTYLTVSPAEFTLLPSTVSYLIFRTAELVEVWNVLPTTFQVILAQVVTNASGIVEIQTQSGTTTAESNAISNLASTSAMALGQYVFGSGIPLGSYITGITDATDITISEVSNVSLIDVLTFSGGITDMRVFQPLIYASEAQAEESTLPPTTGAGGEEFDVIGSGGGNFSSYTAGQAIPIFNLVYATATSDVVMLADNTTPAIPALAISTMVVGVNDKGTFLNQGQISNPAWNWTLGTPIFLGTGGGMTQTAPLTPFTIIQQVATPITPTTIEFNPMGFIRN